MPTEVSFVEGTRLEAGASLVVAGIDPAETIRVDDFRRRFSIDTDIAIVGPYASLLGNQGGAVTLVQSLDGADPEGGTSIVDYTVFDATPPWPGTTAGGGHSLQRTAVHSFGGLAPGWRSLIPSPGSVAFAIAGDLNHDGQVNLNDIRPWFIPNRKTAIGGTCIPAAGGGFAFGTPTAISTGSGGPGTRCRFRPLRSGYRAAVGSATGSGWTSSVPSSSRRAK